MNRVVSITDHFILDSFGFTLTRSDLDPLGGKFPVIYEGRPKL